MNAMTQAINSFGGGGAANPRANYWLADDGRVFSGPQEKIVDANDPSYQEFVAKGYTATRWAVDETGAQTDAALQAAVGPQRMFVNLDYYTAHAREVKLASNITVNGLPFATDAYTFMSLNSAYIYTQANTASEFSWKLPDGSFITLNKLDIAALHNASNSYGQACYACEDDTLTKIEAGTIATREQVDAAFAAVSNSFTGAAMGMEMSEMKVRHAPKKVVPK
jgi:hypothetical protein